jgi:hypothetical protein
MCNFLSLALCEEKLNKLLDQLNISKISSRISDIRQGNMVSGWIGTEYLAGGIFGASLLYLIHRSK